MAARGVHVGARVCLVSDSARRGVVEAHVTGGYWAVQFADTSRNIRVNDLEVLPSDDATFEPSQAPPSGREKEQEKRATAIAARAVQVGVRVCLVSDSARRGVVESQVAGRCWAVQFADTSRNIRVNDLEVLPSNDDTFEPSQAPPSGKEKRQEAQATAMAARGVQVGARSQVAGGHWAVRFADTSRNIRVNDLEVLPSNDDTFEPSRAPQSCEEKRQEEQATAMAARARASPVDRAIKAATPPAAASSRKRRAEASDNAGDAAAAEASADGEKLGDGASDDEPRVKRLRDLGAEALESAPLFSSLDDAHREIARLRGLIGAALVETIDVDVDGAVEAAAEAAARRRATAAPASGLAALTIFVAIKEERDTVTEERKKVTEDRDDQEDECMTAHNFIERQKDVIGGLKDEIGGLRLEIDGLQREMRRRDEVGARRVAELEAAIAELEAAAIEAPPPPTKRRARPK
ncbi:hypothetical protein M885DRAFT_525368 [Pelagophyceae sp. CCMP2097]|nr:hypothetical protein M885DRAFT_525368 [Pelagophyceae sp. CCMP2097]